MLEFTVNDTGIGIKPEDQLTLFQMFGKLHDTKKMNVSGVGLGLYTCLKIVEALGGEIYLQESKENFGSTFVFTVKCKQQQSNSLIASE